MSGAKVVNLHEVAAVQLPRNSWSRVLLATGTVGGNISALGYSEFTPGTVTADLSHEVEELAFVVSGSGRIRLEAETLTVSAGQAIYIPARVWHTVISDGTGNLAMVFSFPSPDYPPTERREPRT